MVLQLSLSVSHCLNHKTKMGIPVPRINCEPWVLMYIACSVPGKSYRLNETLPNYGVNKKCYRKYQKQKLPLFDGEVLFVFNSSEIRTWLVTAKM